MEIALYVLLIGIVSLIAVFAYVLLAFNITALLIAAAVLGMLLSSLLKIDAGFKALYKATFSTTKGYRNIGPRWLIGLPAVAVLAALAVLVIGLFKVLAFDYQSVYGLLVFGLFGAGCLAGTALMPGREEYYLKLSLAILRKRQDPASQTFLHSLEMRRKKSDRS